MVKSSKRLVVGAFAVGSIAAIALSGGGAPVGAGNSASFHGVFTETASGSALGYTIHGSAKMTIGADGTTAKINVSGLDPAKVCGSHLHNGTCASGGGGHYQDVVPGLVVPPNELWFTSSAGGLVPNPGGVAHGAGSATWQARVASSATNARSVIVHEPGGARIACADLS
ncbi:MAG: hypothetical protein O3C27_00280 [Actinomycetota bacterium]|nr:hypothetical protein [Actinomycetota bacterium]